MDADRYQRIKRIFHEVSSLEPGERAGYLARACAGETGLRAEVEKLLGSDPVITAGIASTPAPFTDRPPPEICGAYRLGEKVGEGGMGTVFRATDTRDGADVALKLMHPHVAFSQRFEREVHLGRVIEHPNVVRTLDAGSVDGRPYLVMEFVEGKDLRGLYRELGTVPETLLREIAVQAVAGLEAIHAAGIVHRDLKPENICISRDHRVCIMDLGIAKLQEATMQLTIQGQFLGSLQYAAPEQCDLGEIGPAADLYSLGVVLYELATGHNPFAREQPSAILRAQLDHNPAPAHERNPEVSEYFSEVLATLLRKRPEQRFASAAALRRVLEQGEAGEWWLGLHVRRRLPRIPVSHQTRLHGRAIEMETLREAWRRGAAGEGSGLLIVGEAGLGKTRLIDSFARAVGNDEHVLYGAFPPTGGLRGLCDAVSACFESMPLERGLAAHLPEPLVGPFAALLRSEPSTLGDDGFRAAICDLLRSLARDKPVLWIIDDLHFAPESAQAAARALAHEAQGQRALVLAASREHQRGFETLDLARLPEEAVRRMVRELRPEASDTLASKAGGVPLFVLEIARSPDDLRIPSAVRDLIAARLESVERSERPILQVAAVCGDDFDPDLVAEALSLPLVRVLQELAEVERRLGLVRAEGRRYRFDHPLMREVLYDEIAERLLAEYHSLIAGALQGPPYEVARHLLHGRTPADALPILDEALNQLAGSFRNEDALDLIDRTLPLVDDSRRLSLLLRKARLVDLLGRRDVQRRTAEEACALAEQTGDPATRVTAREALARLFAITGQDELALEHHLVNRDIARDAGLKNVETRCLTLAGGTLVRLSRKEEGARLLAEAQEIVTAEGLRAEEVYVAAALAHLTRRQGRYRESLQHYEKSLALARETGDASAQRSLLLGMGQVLQGLGRSQEARDAMERYIEDAARRGDRASQAIGLGNLGVVLLDHGRLADALVRIREHFRLSLALENRRGATVAQGNLGEIHLLLGDYHQARVHIEAVLEQEKEERFRHLTGEAHYMLGTMARFRGEDGFAHFERAAEIQRSVGDDDREARALIRLGRLDEARRIAEEHDLPAVRALAAALQGDAKAARATLDSDGERIDHWWRLEVHWRLGNVEAARRLLDYAVANAPPEYRESMVRDVSLWREIAGA